MTAPGPEQTDVNRPSESLPPAANDPAAYPPPPPPPYMQPYSGGDVAYRAQGPLGQVRSTGTCILLFIVTLGIYSLYWYYTVHDEMKRYSGQGIGGLVALLLAFFVGIANPYITSSEVGDLYEREGQPKPVSAATGLWFFPGALIVVGPLIWFVKTNGALNDFWASKGQRA
jgi:hypothetical protein